MADDKKRYPSMSPKHWWTIRKRFRIALPKDVTPSYLAPLLGMTAESAKGNILPALGTTGIIDKDGKPTDRAVSWRNDDQYPRVCEEIRQEVYPQELLDLAPDASANRLAVESRFANHTGHGAAWTCWITW